MFNKTRTMPDPTESRILRFSDYTWTGVDPVAYKSPSDDWRDVARHRLVGADENTPFHVRYFEIAPGGHSTLECHQHQHAVIVIRGRGRIRLGERWEEVGFGDVVYVAANDPHQFRSAGDEPFGFICVVSAERDRPTVLED
jgi:ribulose-bisphosphate carboxylase large chain